MMGREAFETATRRKGVSQGSPTGALARYRPQVAVSILVVIVLTGGALYAARVSERALDGGYRLGRAQPHRLVDDDPTVKAHGMR